MSSSCEAYDFWQCNGTMISKGARALLEEAYRRFGSESAIDTYAALISGGRMVIYSGMIPPTPDSSLGDNMMLAKAPISYGAFSLAAQNAISMDKSVNFSVEASGQANFGRIYSRSGKVVEQFTVGVQDNRYGVSLNTDRLVANGPMCLTSFMRRIG